MSFPAAVGFLTRVPVRVGLVEPAVLARAVKWFPLVGAVVGGAVAGVYGLLGEILPASVAATLAVTTGVVVTGAFHEDGLGDVADAMGGRDEAEAVRILKDPRLGTYGTMAMVASFVVRVLALAALDPWTALAIVPCAHAMARAAVLPIMRWGAAGGGLGAAFASAVGTRDIVLALGIATAIGGALTGVWVAAALVLTLGGGMLVARLVIAKLGSVGGDVLGAAEQIGEIAVLVLGAAIVHNAWTAAAWWH